MRLAVGSSRSREVQEEPLKLTPAAADLMDHLVALGRDSLGLLTFIPPKSISFFPGTCAAL